MKTLLTLPLFISAVLYAADAQLPVPQLHGVFPPGIKQGATLDVELEGKNLDIPKTLYFSHKGLTAELLPEPKPATPPKPDAKPATPKFRITAKADVPPGDYDVRFVGKLGLSNPRTFTVSDFAELTETEPNSERNVANRIELNTTINGRINAQEDVDWYVFKAKQGQRILIEAQAWRIDSKMDGVMWLYSSDGKQMASSQDEDYSSEKRDPMIDFDAPTDGEYFVKITDFTYNGGNGYFYRLKILTLPYIDYILPTAAAPGTTAAITFYGRNLPGGEKTDLMIHGRPIQKLTQQIAIPSDPDTATGLQIGGLVRPWASVLSGMEVRVKSPEGLSNPKLLSFSTLPQVAEIKPNNTREKAQRLEVPCAVSGQFLKGDSCHFVFKAKKAERFFVTVYATRIGSPADPDLEVLNEKGEPAGVAQDNGDNIGQLRYATQNIDINYVHTAAADGDVTLRLEHLYRQNQGGPQYVYRLEIEKDPMPDFRLICSPIHEIHLDSHELYQGGRERMDILVFRINGHNDPILVEAKNLPPGVTSEPIIIGKDVKWGTLVVTAASDAPLGEHEFEVVGTSKVKFKDASGKEIEKDLARKARGGAIVWDTVNTPALARMARSLVMAVREKVPFTLTATPNEIKVKQGDPFDINVTIKRREDMPNAIQLTGAGFQLPPGMEIPVTTIEKDKTDGKVTVKTEKMKDGVWSFIIGGDGQVPAEKKNIRCVYPSNIIKITVEPKEAKK